MKKGISLISLIITIVVAIIIAAITLGNGFNSVSEAGLAKFTSDFSNYESAVEKEVLAVREQYALKGVPKTDEQIYAEVAMGAPNNSEPVEIPWELNTKLKGTVAWPITVNSMAGIETNKFGGQTYITDAGEVFLDVESSFNYEKGEKVDRYVSSKIVVPENVPPKPIPPRDTLELVEMEGMKIGDYVKYEADRDNSFTSTYRGTRTYTPYTATIPTINWKIWEIDEEAGTITIIPASKMNNECYPPILDNAPHYLTWLEDLCDIFSNPTEYNVTINDVRSMNLEDALSKISPTSSGYGELENLRRMQGAHSNTFASYDWINSEYPLLLNTEATGYVGAGFLATVTEVNGVTYAHTTGAGAFGTNQLAPNSGKFSIANQGRVVPMVILGRGLGLADDTGDGSSPSNAWKFNKIMEDPEQNPGGSHEDIPEVPNYANAPTLVAGMIPVYYDSLAKTWKKADSTNNSVYKWYNYDSVTKQWANAVTVTSARKSYYSSASVGTPINENDVLGYFVWIPRYGYKIDSAYNHKKAISSARVQIKFLGGTNALPAEYAENGFIVHPAFTDDPSKGGWDKQLPGFWVSKFEATNSVTTLIADTAPYQTTVACDSTKLNPPVTSVTAVGTGKISSTVNDYGRAGQTVSQYVTVKPNMTSWRARPIDIYFSKSREMAANHGINMDSHLMKNSEWGAVAYLAQSDYGNLSIWNNAYEEGYIDEDNSLMAFCTTITGMAEASLGKDAGVGMYWEKVAKTFESDGSISLEYLKVQDKFKVTTLNDKTTRRFYPYDSTVGARASTTGNIYGIYDMAGGAAEYVSAYLDNGHGNLGAFGSSLSSAPSKYVNVYRDDPNSTSSTNNYNLCSTKYGDAIYETSGSVANGDNEAWFGDTSQFINNENVFMTRGGSAKDGTGAGIFGFNRHTGDRLEYIGFRVTLVEN